MEGGFGGSLSDRSALGPKVMVPWRVLLVAGLLCLAVAGALYEGLAGRHSSAASAGHFRAASHLRSRSSSHQQSLSSLPLGAQGPISDALGAEDPAYRVRTSNGGLSAASPTQRFKASFDQSGVTLDSGQTQVRLSLVAMGYGSSLSALGEVAPRVKANRVFYQQAGLSEWYANGPVGLEQGFTIARVPSARHPGALTLSMALSGNARPSLGSGGQAITLSRAGRAALRYSGLSATDATGRTLHSWLELHAGRILLRVDAAGARYPLRIDPWIQQGEKLTGGGEKGEEGNFAYSAALAVEGSTTTALIGGPADNGKLGAAWVFTRSGSTWTQQGSKLTGKEEAGSAEFGKSVALSLEGSTMTALIGGPADNGGTGAAWVFTRSGSTWTQQGSKLTGAGETGAGEFGYSVALSVLSTTTTALIGGPADNTKVGAAWAFTRSGSTWSAQGAKLTGSGETGAGEFGKSVAMAVEGTTTTALMGGPADNTRVGAAWVFTRASTTWAAQGSKLTGASETGEGEFGYSVALSVLSTTATAVMGGPGDNGGIGAAWTFTRSGTAWTALGTKITGAGETGAGEFGYSVALSIEGTTTTGLFGGPADNGGIGAAWVFTRTTSTWTAQGSKLTGSGEAGEGEFGTSVALSLEGSTMTALMGGFHDKEDVGAAWAYTRSGTTWTQQGSKLTAKSGEEIGEGEVSGKGEFAYSVALSVEGSTTTALIGTPADNGGIGAAWVFTRSGSVWTQQGAKLTAKSGEEVGSAEFGKSVALSLEGSTMTALIGGPADNGGTGAAWVFTRSGSTWTQQGSKLTGAGETGAGEFGYSVALSVLSTTTTALIGGPADNTKVGAAWAFTRSGSTWSAQGAKLTGSGETGAGEFGKSVAMAVEGTTTTALMGGPADNTRVGAAWVFTRASTTWAAQGSKLTGASETGEGEFGYSVALSVLSTTATAVMGGPGDSTRAGAAWTFTRSGTAWTALGTKITGAGETGAGEFGKSVAMAVEGTTTTALLGGPADNVGVGAAWAFTRTTSTWTAQGSKLTGSGETGAGEFGDSVALSLEGSTMTALMGGSGDYAKIGAAWAYTRSGTTWTQQGEKLTAKSGEEIGLGELSPGKGQFGYSVALSENGNTALIGGASYKGGIGAAWVFTRSGSTWTQQGPKLTGSGEIGAGEFGDSVALSASGSTALIGGDHDNTAVGAAWVFTLSGSTWTQQGAKLTAKGGEEEGEGEFGKSVALSGEGTTALIGGPNEGAGFTLRYGAAWVFTFSGSTWTQQGAKLQGPAGEIEEGQFGWSVALSSNGNTALIGGNRNNKFVGAAWVFTRSGSTWTQQGGALTATGEIGEGELGWSVALSSAGNTALIGGPGDNTNVGALWVFTRSGSTWTQQGTKLTGSGEVGEGQLGYSVALSANGNTALAGGPTDNLAVGAAWVFTHSGATWSQVGSKLTGSGEAGEGQFGSSVALSSEGNTALIGGYGDNKNVGAGWVFVNNSPTVETKAASALTQTTATLNASVNPDGAEVSKCELEYGTTTEYKSTPVSCSSPPGNGTTAVAVSAPLTGLTANTTYHFRISATNANGTSKGADETFTTPVNAPTVVTEKASALTQTTATLNASVNPNAGEVTECKFEYGTTTEYKSTPASCSSLPGNGTSAVAVSAPLTGLTANTTYHFRISATNSSGTSKGSDETFKTLPNAPTVVTEKASSVTQTTTTLNATVNPNGGEVSECKFEYGTTTEYKSAPVSCSSLPGNGTSSVAVSAPLTGLTANTTYHFRISATNAGGTSKGSDETFKTLPNAPTVVTEKASSVTQATATLNASVNPNGGEVTKCEFEYGTTTEYKSAPVSCSSLPGNGTSSVAVSAPLTGLTANTTYHFRISATNAGGTSKGSDETFKTPVNAPTVVTEPASSVTQTTATLNATVNPNGGEVTKCEFEYGTTTEYKSAPVSCSSLPGNGTSSVAVSAPLTGLTANTTYHFRISATNAGGTSKGSDETFKTPPNAPTVVTKPASSVAQTTATLNATVNPNGGEVTTCEFEYGTTTEYKSTPVSCSSLPGNGTSAVAVSASLTGLTANTTYHFRISATNAGGTSKGSDETFKTPPNAPTVVTKPASSVAQTTATLNATVNPNGAEVTKCEFEYGTTTEYKSTPVSCSSPPGNGTSAVAVSASLTGLTANTTYHFRISATNSSGTSKGADETFTTLPNAPTVVTKPASSVAQTTATLNATVNPNGGEVTTCEFEYGTTTEYKSTPVSCSSPPGNGTSAVAVSASLTGLTANTTYHFRISATNAGGTSKGSDETFKTPPNAPTVVTKPASSVAQTTATLNATVNPNGAEVTKCEFEYGTTTEYKSTPVSCSSPPGNGTSAVAVSASLTGLTANTTYHFRISATNSSGTSKGADETFTTLPNAPTVVTKPASSVAQTTATLNATVNPNGGEVTKCEFEYAAAEFYELTKTYESSAGCSASPGHGTSPVAVSESIAALSPNTSYHFRISATNAGGTSKGADETFKTAPSPPTVVTKPASSVTQTTATLNATVNPNGGEVSKCEFEYGTTKSYGSTAPCSSLPGNGTSAVAVSASVTGLTPNAEYHFRISATNASGTSKGSDQTFVTPPNPPTVVTGLALPVAQTSATLNATVNPNGAEVSECKLEYGTTNSYGSTAPCAPEHLGSGILPVPVAAEVTGLTPNTTYHFRISASNAGGTSRGSDETFKTSSAVTPPTVVTKPASSVTLTSATLNATVNPNGGEVSECKFEYGTTKSYGSSVPCSSLPGSGSSPVAVSASVTGLASDTIYHFRISATNPSGTSKGADQKFVTNPPTAVTTAATPIAQTTATLNATVNPNGEELTECKFEYGTTNSYGSTASCSSLPEAVEYPVEVSAAITGLSVNTTYHFRIVATNANGTSTGSDETFKTLPNPPTVETKAASSVTQTAASLNASVNPNAGSVSECKFEYGTTNSYGSSASCSSLPGSGTSPVAVSAALSGLAANTTYHFRISATNPGGTSKGSDETFKTPPNPPAVETKPASSVTQTTATLNASVNPNGGEVTACEFEYGTTNSYGSSASCSSLPGAGTSPVAVSAALTGLTANTTYHFRISATSATGTSKGSDGTLKTTPSCSAEGFCASFTHTEAKGRPFGEPSAIAVGPSGNIFVADGSHLHDRILEFNAKHEYVRQFGSPGSGQGQLNYIGGIAINASGVLYVSDSGNNRVEEFNEEGKYLSQFGAYGSGSGQLSSPSAVALDSSGDLWIIDQGNYRVEEFSSSGAYLGAFGESGSAPGKLGWATGLAISGGNLYLVEPYSARVQEFSSSGTFVRAFDEKGSGNGKSNAPYAIATDPTSGNVYVVEGASILAGASANRVQEFSAEGAFITAFGASGVGSGQLAGPRGIAVGSSGAIFIADSGNQRIEEWMLP